MLSKPGQIVQTVLDIIFPIECLGCEEPGAFLCETCAHERIEPAFLTCANCAQPAVVGATHPKCSSPHSIDGIFAAGNFRNVILKQAVKKLKYNNVQDLAMPLAQLLARRWQDNFANYLKIHSPAVTFIPLHPKRERVRGYNQSQLLAQSLSRMLNLNIEGALVRTAHTKDQTKLNKAERAKNISGAFIPAPGAEVRGKNYILVDDVATTGATLKEAARVLKRNGAGYIWGAAVAKE